MDQILQQVVWILEEESDTEGRVGGEGSDVVFDGAGAGAWELEEGGFAEGSESA